MRLKVLKANTDLKGKNLNTKCGIFVNGDKDPWSTFGITTPEEAGVCNRAIMIKGKDSYKVNVLEDKCLEIF